MRSIAERLFDEDERTYAIWVGIGIIGAALSGPILLNQPLRPIQLLFLVLLVVSIIGWKITSAK